MSKPPTVIDPEDWWRDIFTESEFAMLERMFGTIIAAEQDLDERIEIEITIKADAYVGVLLKLIPLHNTGNAALDELIEDLCMMYADDDRIESDNEVNMFMESTARDYSGEDDDD